MSTMKRVQFAVSDEMNHTAASIYGSEFCPNHPSYKVVSWCSTHEISICMVCFKLDHAKCKGVEPLEEAIKSTNSKAELKSLRQRVEETRNIFKRLVKDRNHNIDALENQKDVLKADVKTFKERIYQHLERLEYRLEKEIDLALDRHKHKLEDQIFEYNQRDGTLASLYNDLIHINEDSTENHTILFLKEANVVQRKEEEFLKGDVGSLKNINLQLKMDETVRKVVDVPTIANVKMVESYPTNPPDLQSLSKDDKQSESMLIKVEESVKEYNMDKFKFVFERDIDIKPTFSTNALVPEVTGGMILPDGRLFVVDKVNKRLLGYTAKGQLAKETFMEYEPYAMTYLDVNRFYLTVPSQLCIEIRDYGALQFSERIDIKHHVSGISSYEDTIAVVCENFGIALLDHTGAMVNKIPMKGNKEGPLHFLGKTICYAESKKGTIHVLSVSGEVKFTSTVKGLGYVQGIAVLRDSSFLVSRSSPGNKVTWHFSPDGHQQALREEFESFKSPRSITYEKKLKKLFVANGVRTISIFREV